MVEIDGKSDSKSVSVEHLPNQRHITTHCSQCRGLESDMMPVCGKTKAVAKEGLRKLPRDPKSEADVDGWKNPCGPAVA